jgi:hypothetical protein
VNGSGTPVEREALQSAVIAPEVNSRHLDATFTVRAAHRCARSHGRARLGIWLRRFSQWRAFGVPEYSGVQDAARPNRVVRLRAQTQVFAFYLNDVRGFRLRFNKRSATLVSGIGSAEQYRELSK